MTTETLRPNADGTASPYPWFIYPTSPTTHYDKVDDVTPDEDTTFISTAEDLTPRVDRFLKPSSSIPDGATNITVKMYMRCKRVYDANPVAPNAYQGLYIDAVEYYAPSFNPVDAYADYSYEWTKNPATGLDWTKAVIDAMELACKGTSNRKSVGGIWYYTSIDCTQVWIVISWTVAGVQQTIGDGLTFATNG